MIYYDITDILEYARTHDTLSGIQRVSIQLLTHFVNKHGADKLRLIAWHPIQKRILVFDASYFAGDYRYDQDDFCRRFLLKKYPIKLIFSLGLYRKAKYWRRPLHYGRLLLTGTTLASLPRLGRPLQGSRSRASFQAGDLLFISGATWNFDRYLSILADARKQSGLTICQFIHDLIPLLTPEHVVDDVPDRFYWWLDRLSQHVDFFMTNSKATKADLDTWLAARGLDVPCRVLPLAHQFTDSSRRPSSARRPARRRPRETQAADNSVVHARVLNAARLPYVLCAGTLEPRKNIWTLARVWQSLHAKLGANTPRLVFAGKPGWLNDDFDDFIRGTGSLYGYIRVVESPNDAELEYLYRNCLFSAFPSYKEGWGLPIGECLWLGRPVVCSNASSMPEVGGTLADYIDPTSCESMEAGLMKMITDAAYRERRATQIAAAPLRTWANVADDLWQELTTAAAARTQRADGAALSGMSRLVLQEAS